MAKQEIWVVGEPGGPSGPFYSVVSSTGRLIAMQIPDKDIAYLIASFPQLLNTMKQTLQSYKNAKTRLEDRIVRLEMLIKEAEAKD